MKRISFLLLVILSLCFTAFPSAADDYVDPILVNAPHPDVYGCENNIFIKLTAIPTLGKTASTRYTANYFIELKAEILFLLEDPWDGIEKTSFTLKHTDADGKETLYPLNYAISMMSNLKNSWFTFDEPYEFADLRLTSLIFEVIPYTFDGWTFVFSPTPRGSGEAYCKIEIPLAFK